MCTYNNIKNFLFTCIYMLQNKYRIKINNKKCLSKQAKLLIIRFSTISLRCTRVSLVCGSVIMLIQASCSPHNWKTWSVSYYYRYRFTKPRENEFNYRLWKKLFPIVEGYTVAFFCSLVLIFFSHTNHILLPTNHSQLDRDLEREKKIQWHFLGITRHSYILSSFIQRHAQKNDIIINCVWNIYIYSFIIPLM